MTRIGEATLALAVVLVFGVGLWLFSGQPLGNTGDTTPPIVIDPEAASRGEILAASAGCLACHSVDGSPGSGPTWKGLAFSSRPLTTGESVVADDGYLHESIVAPAAKLVDGFNPVMPTTYAETLTEQDISDLVEYLKTLG